MCASTRDFAIREFSGVKVAFPYFDFEEPLKRQRKLGLETLVLIASVSSKGSSESANISGPRGYKTVLMLNSAELEIYPAHKC